jgi:predicted kinase
MAKVVPNKPALLMLYGFPGSGKTYFSRMFSEHVQAVHMQADRVRAELFEKPRYDKQENAIVSQLMDYMTEEFLNAGVSVIYDVNAMRLSQRTAMRELARHCRATPLIVWFQIDQDSAYARSTQRDRRRNDDKYAAVTDQASFNNVVSHMQNPGEKEDYVVVSGKHTFNAQYTAVARRLRELGLLNIGEEATKAVKPELVNLVPKPVTGRVDMNRRNVIIR